MAQCTHRNDDGQTALRADLHSVWCAVCEARWTWSEVEAALIERRSHTEGITAIINAMTETPYSGNVRPPHRDEITFATMAEWLEGISEQVRDHLQQLRQQELVATEYRHLKESVRRLLAD